MGIFSDFILFLGENSPFLGRKKLIQENLKIRGNSKEPKGIQRSQVFKRHQLSHLNIQPMFFLTLVCGSESSKRLVPWSSSYANSNKRVSTQIHVTRTWIS
jgi:hypothetical protein